MSVEIVHYAWWTSLKHDPMSPIPHTGWVHEPEPPYRVVIFDTIEESEKFRPGPFESRTYDGSESTVDWKEVWPHLV